MNVNQKGVKGLIKVIDDLQDKGFYVFPAFDDHSPIDLVAVDAKGNSFRLQIKYRSLAKNKKSKYELPACSVINGKKVPINRDLIDGWAVYLSDHKKVVYINKDRLVNKAALFIDPDTDYGKLDEWLKSASC